MAEEGKKRKEENVSLSSFFLVLSNDFDLFLTALSMMRCKLVEDDGGKRR